MLNYKKDAKTIIIEMSPDGDGSKSRGFMSKGMIFLTHRMVKGVFLCTIKILIGRIVNPYDILSF